MVNPLIILPSLLYLKPAPAPSLSYFHGTYYESQKKAYIKTTLLPLMGQQGNDD